MLLIQKTLLLIAVVFSVCFINFSIGKESNNKNGRNGNNNVLRPVSVIVTKKSGAITTLLAKLDPPLTSHGYHDITLVWCSKDDWLECLDPVDNNQTKPCRCTKPGSVVEDTFRFLASSADLEEVSSFLNISAASTKSESGEDSEPHHHLRDCAVVAHRWDEDDEVREYIVSPYEKIRDSMAKKIKILEMDLEAKVKEFNDKILSRHLSREDEDGRSSSHVDNEENFDDDDDEITLDTSNDSDDDDTDKLFQKLFKQQSSDNKKKKQKILQKSKKSINSFISTMNSFQKFVEAKRAQINKLRTAVTNTNNFLNSASQPARRNQQRLQSAAGRVLRARLFCNSSSSSSSSSSQKTINFTQIFAQVILPQAGWTPTHTLLITSTNENPSSSTTTTINNKNSDDNNNNKPLQQQKPKKYSEVRMAARISQSSYVDWNDVRLSLRQGAPGEDSTTSEEAPDEEKVISPWIVKIDSAPPPNYQRVVENRRPNAPVNRTSSSSSPPLRKKSKQELHHPRAPTPAPGGATPTPTASMSFSVSETISASRSYAQEQQNEDEKMDQNENNNEAEGQEVQEEDHVSGVASTLALGSFTEEVKISHPVSIPKHSSIVTEIGKGKVSATMHRVVASYRCRQQEPTTSSSSSSSSSSSTPCTLPVFLKANISNEANSYLLGGPTRIFIDGIPFLSNTNNNNNNKIQKSIAPGSWGFVNLGEDTKVIVQRYEKSNILSRKFNKTSGMMSKNWWENLFVDKDAEQKEKEEQKKKSEKASVSIKYEIKITNTRTIPVTIDLREQYPRSNTEEIEVRLSADTLKNPFLVTSAYDNKKKKEEGKESDKNNDDSAKKNESSDSSVAKVTVNDSEEIRWKVEVGAGQSVIVPFGFSLTWTKDKFVHGLTD
jgi:hypothetical protein